MTDLIFTGRDWGSSYTATPFLTGLTWLNTLKIVGLDTETNMTDSILNRVLKVISLADESGDKSWVIEWEFLTDVQKQQLLESIRTKLNIIHNVSFDYSILKKYGLTMEKVYCTMLAEQVIYSGLSAEKGFHSLKGVVMRRFDMEIFKDEQSTFGTDEPLTTDQIQYAAIDVIKLGDIRKAQLDTIYKVDGRVPSKGAEQVINQQGNRGLRRTLWWENEFVKAVADIEMAGVRIHQEKWYGIEDKVKPIWHEELEQLNTIAKEDFWDILEANNWISSKDTILESIWTSSDKKGVLLNHVYDFAIDKTSKVELKKLLQLHDPNFPEGLRLTGKAWENADYPKTFKDKFSIIKLLVLKTKDTEDKITEALNGFLLTHLKQFGVANGWIRPANEVGISWSSPIQRLKVLKGVSLDVESTSKTILEDYVDEHRLVPHYLQWNEVDYQLKMYGRKFYTKHVELDGKFRTRLSQILATGRLSSSSPNFLGLPHSDIYRSCVIPDEGCDLVGSDYDGEELVLLGTLAKEPEWMEAFSNGWDLHSINSAKVYKDRWIDATEEGCKFKESKLKCSCEGHKKMRNSGKAIEFGYAYGMKGPTLGARLKISGEEGSQLLDEFKNSNKNIEKYMARVKKYALTNGHIIEPVFGRIRYFDTWRLRDRIQKGKIENESGNFTIQSAAAAVLKIAVVLLRRWINQNNHQHNIQILLPIHDELLVQSRRAWTTLAKEKVEHYMILAGKLAGFDLKAEALSGESWSKIHTLVFGLLALTSYV